MNWYKHFIGDYMRDTAALTLTEHGVYLLMLQHLYGTEEPLPVGRDLYRLLRCESDDDRAAVDKITHKYFIRQGDGLVNLRAVDEIQQAAAKAEANRLNGAKGGRPRKFRALQGGKSEGEK